MDSETTRLMGSGMPAEFVKRKTGAWNHQDWLEFLARVRMAGYTALPEPEIGRILEEEKARFFAGAQVVARRSKLKTARVR